MFGSTANSGSLFGQNKPAAPASTGGGFSFGQNNNASTTNTSGGLFGAKPAATGTTGGGLFGNTNNAATNPGSTGGFGFGANNNTNNQQQQQQQQPTTGGLFGNNNQSTTTPATGGLFGGNNNTQSTGTTGGGLFGSNTTQNNTNSGGLFGANNNTSTTTGGLFGAKPATATTSTGGLFGTQQQQPSQQQQQQQQPTLSTNTSSQPAFAWSQQTNPQTQSQPLQQNAQQQQQPLSFLASSTQDSKANSNYAITIQEQLTKVKNSWDPTSQQTVLKTYFYNTVPENQSALYTKPANEDEEWDKAYENKPSSNSIPVRAVGFEDLQKRSQTQVNHVAQARVILQQISEKYKMLSDKHELDTASRIVAAKAKHTRISGRILRLVSTLAVLKSKGYQLSPSEEKLVQTFQELVEKSQDPSGLGKTNELWARLAILKEKAKSLGEQVDNSLGIKNVEGSTEEEGSEQTQEELLKIAKVLQEQQTGIKYLNEVLSADKKVLEKLYK